MEGYGFYGQVYSWSLSRATRSKREIKEMTKCNKPITQPMNCETETCVYMTECNKEKCKQRYIGEM